MKKCLGIITMLLLMFASCDIDRETDIPETTTYRGEIADINTNNSPLCPVQLVTTEEDEVFMLEIDFQSAELNAYTVSISNRTFEYNADPIFSVIGVISSDESYVTLTLTRKSDNEVVSARLDRYGLL